MSRSIIMLSFIALFFCQCTNSSVYPPPPCLSLALFLSSLHGCIFKCQLRCICVGRLQRAVWRGLFLRVSVSGSASISVLVRWLCLFFSFFWLLIKLGDKRKRAHPPSPPHSPSALYLFLVALSLRFAGSPWIDFPFCPSRRYGTQQRV